MIRWFLLLAGVMFMSSSWALDNGGTATKEPIRAFHFVLRGVPLDKAYWMVDEAKRSGFNTIVVLITDGVVLQHAPWRKKKGAWARDEFVEWVKYVQEKGMLVVPELKLLTHQEKLFQKNNSNLLFNSLTYDPRNRVIYSKYIFPLLDEIIGLVSPKAIHIGHDEVAGFARWWWRKRLKRDEKMLPAKLFYKDVLQIHEYLKKRGLETWMWGDMLISPDEFPDMKPGPLHGRVDGYGKRLRQMLPRDIVVCDWHYSDDQMEFPSLATFKVEGFRVLGATWKKEKTISNFSRYAAERGADGMIATTWFHVQRREWSVVKKIINISGEIFRKDFPDE